MWALFEYALPIVLQSSASTNPSISSPNLLNTPYTYLSGRDNGQGGNGGDVRPGEPGVSAGRRHVGGGGGHQRLRPRPRLRLLPLRPRACAGPAGRKQQ